MTCATCRGIAADDPRFEELNTYIASMREVPGALIAVLHRAQQIFGFLPQEVQTHVAQGLKVPPSDVYGVVTFYNLFSTEPTGMYPISICMGTACYLRGADRILSKLESELNIKPGEVTEDGLFSLEVCRCIGACSLAPVISVAGEIHGHVSDKEIPKLLALLRQQALAAVPAEPVPESEPEVILQGVK